MQIAVLYHISNIQCDSKGHASKTSFMTSYKTENSSTMGLKSLKGLQIAKDAGPTLDSVAAKEKKYKDIHGRGNVKVQFSNDFPPIPGFNA